MLLQLVQIFFLPVFVAGQLNPLVYTPITDSISSAGSTAYSNTATLSRTEVVLVITLSLAGSLAFLYGLWWLLGLSNRKKRKREARERFERMKESPSMSTFSSELGIAGGTYGWAPTLKQPDSVYVRMK